MATVSDYVLEPIRPGAEFTLYRARQSGNSSSLLAVAAAAEPPPAQTLRRLEHEYSLAAELEADWAAKPLALTRHQGRTILVLADPGGEPLDRVLERQRGRPLDPALFLRLAINLATVLGHAHRRGLIHKDVKPENVIVDGDCRAWLAGFGIASQVPRERQTPAPPETIAGTLAYMSPEQTGRMNRSVDTRSDLYSLGVTLYRVLTGVLPFTAGDPLEWIHCHIARQAIAPADRGAVPEPLSAIVMKLLAKNAEDRYQTAAGLEADLRRCLTEWQAYGRIDPFPLGTNDSSDRLLIPEKLHGREREIDALIAAFDRVVAQGTTELVLVSGYSGVGKSSVVNELHKVLVPPRGLFAAGKFDQYRRDVPYATLAQAFRMLVRQILVKNETEIANWRYTLLEALGPNGQLMVNLVPELEFVIGKQPPVADLPPQEARGRFQLVFRRFLGAFARPEHPLALFLDDLQWLDTATLELLERLVADPDVRHVLLIGAYRDNEVSSSHPLMRTLAAIRGAGARPQEIVLAPLGLDDVERIIADALRCRPDSVGPLALLVYEKMAGNPFFAIQFLATLVEEGLLRFDRAAAAWIWDLDGIRAKGYSDNVVDLMLGKLRRLPHRTQTAIQQLSCLGNVADMALLSLAFGQSHEEIHAPLWDAVRSGLILRLETSYVFLHDRIQEAAYKLIPEMDPSEVHLRIGRALLASLTEDGLSEHLFVVANQLNRGAHLLADRSEKARVAAIDLGAGRKAKASAAYTSAQAHFAAGMALLDETDWSTQYELKFRLGLECVECELLSGNSERAEQMIAELLPRAATRVDEAGVYHLKVQLDVMRSDCQQAVENALMCLHQFGIDMPAHPTEEQVQTERDNLLRILNGRPVESLIDLPLMTDPELRAAMKVLSFLLNASHITDFRLCCLQACRMVALSVRHGTSGDAAAAFAYWGSLLGSVFNRRDEGYRFAKLACDVVEKHDFVANRAIVYLSYGVIAPWTQPLRTAIDFSRTGIRAAIETGSPFLFCAGVSTLSTNLLLRGDPLDAVWRETQTALDFIRAGVKSPDWTDTIVSKQRFIAAMQGRTATFSTFSDAQFDEAAFEARLTADRMPPLIVWYWILKLQARFLSGDYTEALDAASKTKPLLHASAGQIAVLDYFLYAALTVAALFETATADDRQVWLELLGAHREQLREWAENYPPTFADKHTLVLAEIARLERRDGDALRLYEEAIHFARDNGFVQNEGLAHELAARYCLARNLETAGYAHLRSARHCYEHWGAHGKVKQLDERYPRLREERTPASAAAIGVQGGQLDVETAVKASQAISSEMFLPELVEKLLRLAVENAGAERGMLILFRDGEPRIEAEASTRPGKVEVVVRQTAVAPHALPHSVLHYVIRTQERVLLDDASADHVYANDEYVRQNRSRSVLCLPIVKQPRLVGALYLENGLTPGAFTPDRITVLQLLTSQAAVALENATLYSDLQLQAELLQRLPVSAWTLTPDGTPDFVNQVWLEFSGQTLDFVRSRPDAWMTAVHPEDREAAAKAFWAGVRSGQDFAIETRSLRARDGTYRWHLQQAVVLRDAEGRVLRFVGTTTDIDDQKRGEEKIRQSEREARQLLDLSPLQITELGPDGARLYTNRASLDYYGITLEEWKDADLQQVLHPEDAEIVRKDLPGKLQNGSPFEYEVRLRRKDGHYRWFHRSYSPMWDEQGRITRWYAAGTDIDDRKLAEQRLQEENVALREEIDKASMFEEIVGTSAPLKKVLSRISRVAPTDSSVLITGETGTGKELVARAIHGRSRRSSYPFVSVNCAVIPRDLIASELFGHEKGAFTGATQRRPGRFELAERGTIFLDEVGELPAETQIALLRVLQEREYERIGGSGSIRTDVRVIAATNRDLEAAIAAGTFRSDLYYRLNVFPIEVPTLRERREDIPLLVTYFLNRYSRKAGRHFTAVDKRSLDLLQAYAWPGNIRELQNVIERSVIVSDAEIFSVDESWLSRQPRARETKNAVELPQKLAAQEKEIIEAALRECGGRVSGSTGAAARLGIPGSTLESKIKSLGIDKHRFKTPTQP
jgi:PAS domain S-box-containing protein